AALVLYALDRARPPARAATIVAARPRFAHAPPRRRSRRAQRRRNAMSVSGQRTARIVGWLFVGTFVFSIPGYLLYGPLLDHHDYIVGAGHDRQIAFGALLEMLTAVCNIGTAVFLYPLAKRQNEAVALGYVASRIVES